ncbi:cytochrome P450 9e2-like [Leptopilina boulardi]|uniref:cytochrome P450 9e2-like n=1 Tax=Leptopilina boulardi TaxID=63433 RepID=UPI0021F60785|nr:cytochrome P450 9e2-like [Leptopilina boulardi]
MIFLATIISLIIGCLGIYLYSKINIFKRSNVPHMKPWPIVGNMGSVIFNKTSLPKLLINYYNSIPQAKYFGFYEFTNPIIVICDPELIKSIGIKNFVQFTNRHGFADENQDPILGYDLFSLKNDKWHQMRNILTPSFTSSKMKIMFKIIFQQSDNFINHIFKETKTIEMDMRKSFQKLVIDLIASCSYGISSNCVNDEENDLYILGPRAVNLETLKRKKFFLSMFPKIWKTFGMTFLNKDITKLFQNIVESTIMDRKEKNPFISNMIHLMIDGNDKNKNITLNEMSAQVFIFFLGAFHTTSGLLTFLCYDLAINPQIQKRLQEEIDSLQEKFKKKLLSNEIIDDDYYKDINNLTILDAIVKEALRLHSLVPILERVCSDNFVLPPALPHSKPFTLKRGTMLWIPAQAIHQNQNYYNDPNKFDPDRFLKDEKILINTPKYMPFGIGPRNCIAYRFALLIFKVVVFHFFARCNVNVCSKTPISLEMSDKTLTNVPKNEIWLQVEERKF